MANNNCIFCKITKKELTADLVYENDDVLAFKDINPKAPIHILVIPKEHIESFSCITEKHTKIIREIIKAINHITKKTNIFNSGFRIIVNNGPDAGQAVDHLHFHIMGGHQLSWP